MRLFQLPVYEVPENKLSSRAFRILRESWWLALLAALLLVFHQKGMIEQGSSLHEIESQLKTLKVRASDLKKEQRLLEAQLNSGSDPAWIEMVLMKNLGLVPKGYQRVHFEGRRSS